MNSLLLVLGSIVLFVIAYMTYGSWLGKQWGVDEKIPTPAHTMMDGVDYVPSKPQVLLGHHFASIAGAGPITGPIQAAIFGWVPVVLWIIVGGIFFGGVHDYGSLVASMKHKGKSIGSIIEENMGKTGKSLFSIFAWLTLVLVVAAFANIVAKTFASTPEAATSSILMIALAVIFGYFVYRRGVSLGIATVFGVIGVVACILLGIKFPLALSVNTWVVIIALYILVASVAPVWILLQPRDYLNSFLLYAMIIGAAIGIAVYQPKIQLDAFTGVAIETKTGTQWLFPMLFITVACGAISGFHSLVGSGTSSKQIANEKDAKLVGYGGMLIECVLAIIAIITAAYLTRDKFGELMANGGPIALFSDGVGEFMSHFGIPKDTGKSFVSLAVSAFALTSLDTATRLARFIFQEYFEKPEAQTQSILTNKYVATVITVVAGCILAVRGYEVIWPIFGSANQLLAALALLALATWIKNENKNYQMFVFPMIFMFLATLSALLIVMKNNLAGGNFIMVAMAGILFVLALILVKEGADVLIKNKKVDKVNKKLG
ncbi:carbon starvation protein A [Filifactor villosus]|uniref:Carbon starvation protein A n=1 Tax=Filifactor villosus TaxID=29374 RepID=A0ABV9QLP7_9FIRM